MSFNALAPIEITAAMLSSSTIAEPDTGEALWVSAATYALEQEAYSSLNHKIYSALIAHTGRTTDPSLDPTYWNEERPTNRWAPFDLTISTASTALTSTTYVLLPGFFNAIRFYGLNGATLDVSIKDEPGGTVVFTHSESLINDPLDWYDWAFGTIRQKTKFGLADLVPYPNAELTITISAGTGVAVGIGMIAVGDYRPLLDGALWGDTQYGASAEPVNFSDIEVDKYGNLRIIDGRRATDMRGVVSMSSEVADFFLQTVQELLSTPVAVVATDMPGFTGLDVFGLMSGSMSYDSFGAANFNFYVKGLV